MNLDRVRSSLLPVAAVAVGALAGVHDRFPFRPGVFLLCVAGALLAGLGAADVLAGERLARGGALLGGGLLLGVVVGFLAGPAAVGLALVAVLLLAAYSLPPVSLEKLGSGIGESAVFLGYGPIPVLGGYFGQTGELSIGPLYVAVAIGLYAAAWRIQPQWEKVGRWALPAVALAFLHFAVRSGDAPRAAYAAAAGLLPLALLFRAAEEDRSRIVQAGAVVFSALVACAYAWEAIFRG